MVHMFQRRLLASMQNQQGMCFTHNAGRYRVLNDSSFFVKP